MRTYKNALALINILFCAVLAAQDLSQPPDQKSKDPFPYQVQSDNRVTFQLKAPQAISVAVQGDWPGGLGGNSTTPMVKDEKGIWSVTVGPLQSDSWHFTFAVDGVTFTPPAVLGPQTTNILPLPPGDFVIPGPYGDDFAPHDVQHGTVADPYVPFLGLKKHIVVYTPSGYYEDPAKRYPVLYITNIPAVLEGQTNLHFLLDNLIASGRMKPMIVVVMDPNGPGGNSVGWASFQGAGNQTGPMLVKASQAIADEIVPWVDKAFRTIPDRDHRAIAGFSSEGSTGFMTGANNPDKFSTIGAFSGGFPTWPGVAVQIHSALDPSQYIGPDLNRVPDMTKLGALIPKLNASANMKFVYLASGLNEPLIQTHQLMKKFLEERGIKYYSTEQPGYTHDWRFVRWCLRDFLPRIF
jgi:enterochelin esterase family protein